MNNFKLEKEFEEFLRKYNEAPDIIKFKGIIYTMENYDIKGKQINYRNKETTNGIYVNTSNRYKKGYKDTKVIFEENEGFYRTDISYAEV